MSRGGKALGAGDEARNTASFLIFLLHGSKTRVMLNVGTRESFCAGRRSLGAEWEVTVNL